MKLRDLFPLLLFFLFPLPSQGNPLQDSLKLALLDCQALQSARYIRYLDLYNIPKEQREKTSKVLHFVLNSLSRYKIITPLRVIPDKDGPRLLVIDLEILKIPSQAWDDLFELGSGRIPQPETYYNLPVFEIKEEYTEEEYQTTERQQYTDGSYRNVPVTKFRKVKKLSGAKKAKKLTDPPWLSLPELESLRKLTHTRYPLGRADWFAVYSLWGKGYYRFLGIDPDKGKEKDLEDLARLDRKLSKESILKAVTDTKIVTLNDRILVRFLANSLPTGSYFWESLDTDEGIDDGDFVLNLINPTIKAKEIIFSLPNGLQGYGLSNAEGKLLEVAAINIAVDKRSGFQDAQVWTARNCITCHAQGLWEVQDKIRALSRNTILGTLSKAGTQKKVVDEVLEAFLYQPDPVIQHDQQIYASSVRACNGWTPEANANAYEQLVVTYFEKPLTLEAFSRECGLDPAALSKLLKSKKQVDHTLTGPLLIPPLNTWRTNWENRGFAALMLALEESRP